jgi:DUF971 family protein
VKAPREIRYHKRAKVLEVCFEEARYELPAELLRVYSPSAEVRGHAPSERKLETGKKHVGITAIEPVGNYAVRIVFDDGHDTGLYAWQFLEELGREQEDFWARYLADLKAANASRLPAIPVGHFSPPKG